MIRWTRTSRLSITNSLSRAGFLYVDLFKRGAISPTDLALQFPGNVQWFRVGLVFKAHRRCVSLNARLESNKEEKKKTPKPDRLWRAGFLYVDLFKRGAISPTDLALQFPGMSAPRSRNLVSSPPLDNLLVRIHFIVEMIGWTGLAPWECEFPFQGSLTSTFLCPPPLSLWNLGSALEQTRHI